MILQNLDGKSILEMANGAILEQADYGMKKILDNLFDYNTDFKTTRELHVVLKFKIDSDRRTIFMEHAPKSPKLAPTKPLTATMYVSSGEGGEMKIMELTEQTPGQVDIDGNEQTQPVLLRIV